MSLKKRILKAPQTQNLIAWLLAMYIRLVYFTSRRDRHVDPLAVPYVRGDANALFLFWHGRMMMMLAFTPPGRKMRVLSTPHRDGQLGARVVQQFGNYTIYGSSARGGRSAAMEIVRALEAGDNISITPEGPKGPAQVLQGGAVALARLAGKPIVPVTFSATRFVRFNSWDRFMLALPFGRIALCVGAPIVIAKDDDDEAVRLHIEQAMNALVEKADGLTHADRV
ncbi:MAG: lysophospholipid acyltransferase family protein [Pseudomonadota bacterium]|nr:lysophospholipid acyltransferase family protein [Pseudomonadota bacterium]